MLMCEYLKFIYFIMYIIYTGVNLLQRILRFKPKGVGL